MNTTPESATEAILEPDAAYVLAILRGEVPAALASVHADQWPDIIEALRALGYEIRETTSGYQLVTGGIDDDGTGYSVPATYQPTDPDTIHRIQGKTKAFDDTALHSGPTGGEPLHVALSRARTALEHSEPEPALPHPRESEANHMDAL